MKCRVKVDFADKFDNSIIYKLGDVVDFDEVRASSLIGFSILEKVDERAKTTQKKKTTKK